VVGLFVIGAFALGVIALLSFGGVSFFSVPQRFVVYFDESAHGLDRGSPVKLGGVHVGRVVDLNVRYDERVNRSVVRVLCELNKDIITDIQGAGIDVSSRDELQHLIDRGLRAQLGVQSLATGLLFVQLDFYNPHQYPPDPNSTDPKYAVVPAVPSAIAEFQSNLTGILNDIKKVDFAGLGSLAQQVLTDAHRQLDGLDLKGLAAQWQKTGASVDALVNAPEIKSTLAHLDDTVVALRVSLAKLDDQVGTNGAQLQATLKDAQAALNSVNAAAASAQHFIQVQGGVGDELASTLRQVSAAAASVQQLADYLERNPNALLVGKKQSR
jgi:paraquat-inducible protein B